MALSVPQEAVSPAKDQSHESFLDDSPSLFTIYNDIFNVFELNFNDKLLQIDMDL